ncbi:hypothetical protein KDH83_26710, partial [Achromobacter sp. Marseille-Q0513]|uniref:hypothetical protein n=1 Tax=Achromobacter sp. Marseille-Q0513 TaxID=2829161 RepID=UPI001BA272BA
SFASGVGRRGAGLEQGGADGSEKNGFFHGSLLFSRGLLMETAFYGRKIDYLSKLPLERFRVLPCDKTHTTHGNAMLRFRRYVSLSIMIYPRDAARSIHAQQVPQRFTLLFSPIDDEE